MESIKDKKDKVNCYSKKRILIAETVKKQQTLIKLALGGMGVELDFVNDLETGKRQLEKYNYDIICTNVELLNLADFAYQRDPKVVSVLMTDEDSFKFMQNFNDHSYLSNVVSRRRDDKVHLIRHISTTISKLITGDLFGLEKYLNWGIEIQEFEVTGSQMRKELLEGMQYYMKQIGIRDNLSSRATVVAEEMLMNAIYDAPVDEAGNSKYNSQSRSTPVILEPNEFGKLRYASDGILFAVSVIDPFGGFEKETIFSYLDTCFKGKAGSINEAMGKGGAGRGTFMIIGMSDLVVFNVHPGIKTEVTAMFDLTSSRKVQSTSFHYFRK